MKKIVRLTESDLTRIVTKIISEQPNLTADIKGATRKVAPRIIDMTQTGVEPNPNLDSNARKLYEFNKSIYPYLRNFIENVIDIKEKVSSDNSTVPEHIEQKKFILGIIENLLDKSFSLRNTMAETMNYDDQGKGIYRKK